MQAEDRSPHALLVGANVDALGELARALRREGVRVSVATSRAAAS